MRGVKIIPTVTKTTVKKEMSVNVALTKFWVIFFPSSESFSCKYFLKVGMNATEIEFSANNRLNKFGIINAIPNASEYADVPKNLAFVISLSRPMIRDNSVRNESDKPLATIECCFFSVF